VSAPSEKEPQQGQGLPDPELNPLTNPLLAKNMGRWAEVYFTSPPEKREEAVQELLRELKGKETPESEATPVSTKTSEIAPAPTQAEQIQTPTKTEEIRAPEPAAAEDAHHCPACLHKNRENDRFCGLCGFPLNSEATKEAQKTVQPPAPLPAPSAAPGIERTDNGWEWLRDRNLATFNVSTASPTNSWKYVMAVLVLALCALGAYFVWGRSAAKRAGPVSASAPQPPLATEAKPAEGRPVPEASTPAPPSNQAAPPDNASADEHSTAREPEAANTPAEASASPELPVEEGRQELNQAKRYLEGNGVPKSSTAAAVLLWKSVAKQNSQAVLLLSDLYVRGDGVPQSCDQARLLLSAAAKRGSTAATDKLATLQNAGCR
jgi:hypothetical protein